MSLSKPDLERQVNSSLREFADRLKATSGFHKLGVQHCDRIIRFIQRRVRRCKKVTFSIAATYYAGSVGKHTDVKKPDFDLVMMVNNRIPPFEDVLQFFESILLQCARTLKIKPSSIYTTRYSIHFVFEDGVEVDLLPATPNVTSDEIYQKIQRNLANKNYYSSSLVRKQIGFMKKQDAFTHAVVRFSKCWYKSMNLGDKKVSGGSTIFELLATAAVIEEKQARLFGKESMIDAFTRVVDRVATLDQLKLAFQCPLGTWQLKSKQSKRHKVGPYLTDPSNEKNNFLADMKPEVFNIFKNNGLVMQERLKKLKETEAFLTRVNGSKVTVNVNRLFAPVPT